MCQELKIGEYWLMPYENKKGEVKSFYVSGDTYIIRRELKEIGGIWGAFVKDEKLNKFGAWLFSCKKIEEVKKWLIKYSKNPSHLISIKEKKGKGKNTKEKELFPKLDKNRIENSFENFEVIFETKTKISEYNIINYVIKNNKIIIEHNFKDLPNDIKPLIKALLLTEMIYNTDKEKKKVFDMIRTLFLKIQIYDGN